MAACHSATEITAVAALSAGNLKAVAEAVLQFSPNVEIIFIADNDIKLDGTNPGLKAATDAAVTFHARLAIPELGGRSCDFWDVWSERGPEYVEQTIAAAAIPTLPLLAPSPKHRNSPRHDALDQQNQDQAEAPESWPEPQPLVVKVEPEPYPIDVLPDLIREAVEEVAGFVKAPIPLVACSALGAISLTVQGHVDIKRAEKLTGPVGLFLLTIADSGERKSTCDAFFTKTIRDYEEAQAEAAKPILKDQRAEMEAWQAKYNGTKEKIKQLAKDRESTTEEESALRDLEHAKPEPQRVPRLLYSDATPEALADALAKQWPSGGIVSAEAGIVFGSHGMGKDSVMRNLAMMNQLWDGNPLTIDRKTTDSFTVRGARLTVALQVQEPTLREFFNRSGALARGTGFLARFLTSCPESTQGFRPFIDAPENWPHLAAFEQRLADILNQHIALDEDGALTPHMLTLSPEAKAAWVEYHDETEEQLKSGGELYDVRDVASKSADNAARLAALFHIFKNGVGGVVGLESMEAATRIAAWHLNEARRFFGELALPEELLNITRLDTWLINYCRREHTHLVPIAKLQQGGPSRLRRKADIEAVIAVNPILLNEDVD
jgi:putative DNA primase/helicase